MPNHVTNFLMIEGDVQEVAKAHVFMTGDNGEQVDFEEIIPLGKDGDARDLWGTKWNAYDVVCRGYGTFFDTAWSTPYPIFEALANKFPLLKITVLYADEDIGYNCGMFKFFNGDASQYTNRDGNIADMQHTFKNWTEYAIWIKALGKPSEYYDLSDRWDIESVESTFGSVESFKEYLTRVEGMSNMYLSNGEQHA